MARSPWNPSTTAAERVKDALPPPAHCDECKGKHVAIKHHADIYGGRTFSTWPWVYACEDCGARVGMHPGTNIPLGYMAGEETRKARMEAKELFEPMHEDGHMTRGQAYQWLAIELRVHISKCHFGMFDLRLANRAKAACQKFWDEEAAR